MSRFLSRRYPNGLKEKGGIDLFSFKQPFKQQLDHHSFDASIESASSHTFLTPSSILTLIYLTKSREPWAKVSLDRPSPSLRHSFHFTVSSLDSFNQAHHHHNHLPSLWKSNHPAVIKTEAATPLNLQPLLRFGAFFSTAFARGGVMGGRRYCQHTHTLVTRARSDTPP